MNRRQAITEALEESLRSTSLKELEDFDPTELESYDEPFFYLEVDRDHFTRTTDQVEGEYGKLQETTDTTFQIIIGLKVSRGSTSREIRQELNALIEEIEIAFESLAIADLETDRHTLQVSSIGVDDIVVAPDPDAAFGLAMIFGTITYTQSSE